MPEFPIPSARILLVSQIQGGGATGGGHYHLFGTPMFTSAQKLASSQ